MGADIVIAVHLEVAPADPQKIQSLFSVRDVRWTL